MLRLFFGSVAGDQLVSNYALKTHKVEISQPYGTWANDGYEEVFLIL